MLFPFSYYGNKDRELKKYDFISIFPDGFENMNFIEPFCGSFAFSRFLISKGYNNEIICNDIDSLLIQFCELMKNKENRDVLLSSLFSLINKFKSGEYDKEYYKNLMKNNNNVLNYYLKNVFYNFKKGLYPTKKRMNINYDLLRKKAEYFENYKNITFLNIDGVEIIEKYKDDEKTFLFLDPPFLLVDNQAYKQGNNGIIKLLKYMENFKNFKCKILMCHIYNIIIELLIKHSNLNIKLITDVKFSGYKENKIIYFQNY